MTTSVMWRAAKRLHQVLELLSPCQGRVARRNARRRAVGAMKALRNAMDKEFPAVSKLKPPAKPKEKKPKAHTCRRVYTHRAATLFARVAADTFGFGSPRVQADYGTTVPAGLLYVGCGSHGLRWLQLVQGLAAFAAYARADDGYYSALGRKRIQPEVSDLLRRFWTETLPLSDLQLAAEHREFQGRLPKRKGKEVPC